MKRRFGAAVAGLPVRRRALAAGAGAVLLGVGLSVAFVVPAGAGGPPPPPPPAGPAAHQQDAWSECNTAICIDSPPDGPSGLDGSGGWGWTSSANAPVTTLTVGKPATFTVTELQPASTVLGTPGSITLTYSSQDFSLASTDSRSVTGTDPFTRGGVMVFQETGSYFSHTAGSDAFTFTPQNPTATALVTATVRVGDKQASETFPVTIQAAPPAPPAPPGPPHP